MPILLTEITQKCMNPPQQHKPKLKSHIQIPKTLIDSRSSVIGLIPLEQNPQQHGSNCFWPLLLSYLQIEHYNIHFNKLLTSQKPIQTQPDQKQQQRSQDALSIGSSINIWQRKVSFGVINYRNEQANKKKPKKPHNLWMIINQTDQQKLSQVLQTEKRLNQVIKKIKLLAYEYAHKKDQAGSDSKPIHSVLILKAFELLFPKSQKQLTDLFVYQKGNVNSILQFITQSKTVAQRKNELFSKYIGVLFKALNDVTMNKILTLNQKSQNSSENSQNDDKFTQNMTTLMRYFGFEEGKDFKTINSRDENNPQYSNLINFNIESLQNKLKQIKPLSGIQFQNGFFRTFYTQRGYLISINIESLQNVNQHVRKHFIKPFDPQSSKQRKEQPQITEQKNPQEAVLTWQQTHFHFLTPSNFISRYNNRYFKNQRLIYKQKSKLQSRFKQQQVQDLILQQQNYECGYQISINSKHGNILSDSRNHQNPAQRQCQNVDKLQNPNLNPTLQHSFSQKRDRQPFEIRQNYKDKFFQQNSRPFYVQEDQQIIQETQYNIRVSEVSYEKKRISREQEIERLYNREDFEISDNEILDDIERLLI